MWNSTKCHFVRGRSPQETFLTIRSPGACGSSRSDVETALASVQSKDPQRTQPSQRVRTLARRDKNVFVSGNHRPPLTCCVWHMAPPVQGTRRSLACVAAANSIPFALPLLSADPSPRRTLTTASWAPPYTGNPSATTSSRLASACNSKSGSHERQVGGRTGKNARSEEETIVET